LPIQTRNQTRLARDLRQNMTDAERVLWTLLRDRAVTGERFRRQHPIDRYVVDFVCPRRALVVELDGAVHDDPAVRNNDRERTAVLERLGYREIRFLNEEVAADPHAVVRMIRAALAAAVTNEPPSPALRERGGG